MRNTTNIREGLNASKIVSIFLMCCCLTLLVGLNFFVYPSQSETIVSLADNADSNDEDIPKAPEEEKSSNSGNNTTIQEEYLHEKHSLKEMVRLSQLIHDRIMLADKLQVVHFELLSPPPEA